MANSGADSAFGSTAERSTKGHFGGFLMIAIGVVLLPLKILSAFLGPVVFFGVDIVVIPALVAVFARRSSRPWWRSAAFVAGPTFLWNLFVVTVALGPGKVAAGIGRWWLISLFLVPATAIGTALFAKRASAQP